MGHPGPLPATGKRLLRRHAANGAGALQNTPEVPSFLFVLYNLRSPAQATHLAAAEKLRLAARARHSGVVLQVAAPGVISRPAELTQDIRRILPGERIDAGQ